MKKSTGRNRLKEFENVITEFQEQLFRFAFFRTGSLADSQDIVQDVFIKLYHLNGHLSSVNNIRYYLFRSISNACTDYHRKNKKYKFEMLEKADIPDNMHEEEASHQMLLVEEYKRIEGLLKDLPDEQAETIRLRVWDEMSFADIAEIMEVPVTTVKSRFKYGIDKLKSKIDKKGEINYGM
jgi:RNA polymerase sigma-70 factor (ECF subfamily)